VRRFATRMKMLNAPSFGGIGIHTKAMDVSYPKQAGHFYLAGTLRGVKINGALRVSNGVY